MLGEKRDHGRPPCHPPDRTSYWETLITASTAADRSIYPDYDTALDCLTATRLIL